MKQYLKIYLIGCGLSASMVSIWYVLSPIHPGVIGALLCGVAGGTSGPILSKKFGKKWWNFSSQAENGVLLQIMFWPTFLKIAGHLIESKIMKTEIDRVEIPFDEEEFSFFTILEYYKYD